MSNNRKVCGERLGDVTFSAHVFNGEDESLRGKCSIFAALRSGGSSADITGYGRAADLRRIGEAFIAAADDVERVEGA